MSIEQEQTHIKEFRFIRIVQDIALMRSFYEKIFNWSVIEEWDSGVMYNTGISVFELIQDAEAKKPNLSSRITLSVPDVWSLFEKLKDKVEIVFPLRNNSWGDTSFRINDPEGFPITFFTKK